MTTISSFMHVYYLEKCLLGLAVSLTVLQDTCEALLETLADCLNSGWLNVRNVSQMDKTSLIKFVYPPIGFMTLSSPSTLHVMFAAMPTPCCAICGAGSAALRQS